MSFYIHYDRDLPPLRVKLLSTVRYPNGDVFFVRQLCEDYNKRCCDVVMIHNNFMRDPDGKTKIGRLQKSGFWIADNDANGGRRWPPDCCRRPERRETESLLAAPIIPPSYPGGWARPMHVRAHRGEWTAYLDLVRLLRQGFHVVLEHENAPQNSLPGELIPTRLHYLLRNDVHVVDAGSVWLFLSSIETISIIANWLGLNDGFPPRGSLQRHLQYPMRTPGRKKEEVVYLHPRKTIRWSVESRTFHAVRICEDVPCWNITSECC